MDRQPVYHRFVYGPPAKDSVPRRTPEKQIRACVWLLRCVYTLFPLCRKHRHDHWIISRYRDSSPLLQLWWIFSLGIYDPPVYLPEAGCASDAGAAATLRMTTK